MNEVFFVCEICKKPGFEIPVDGKSGSYHKTCSISFVEEKYSHLNTPSSSLNSKAFLQVAKVSIKDGYILIDHPYNLRLLNEYRKIPVFKWDGENKLRKASLKKLDGRAIDFLIGIREAVPEYNWVIPDEVYLRLEELSKKKTALNKEQSNEIEEAKSNFSPDLDLSFLKVVPFGYQKAGISFLEKAGGTALIGDEMGLGKTLQAIGYVVKNGLRAIVVTTASLKYNWVNEIKKFSEKKAHILGSEGSGLSEADFVITNYDQLKKWEKILSSEKFDCVILDESHYISNISSARTKLVFKIFKKVKKRILLSGTPIKNRPVELYPQLKFLKPDDFSNKNDFGFRYCGPTKGYNGYWEFKGASNLDELNQRISSFYIRRKKTDVLKDLPEKRVSNVVFQLDKVERKEYDSLIAGLISNESGAKVRQKEASLIELMKFCSIKKVDKVEEFVRSSISEDATEARKIIIFAHFQNTQKELKKRFGDLAVSVLGGDTPEERQRAVDRFQNEKDVRIFIGSTLAAGAGLNLTASDTVIFADLIWVPADLKQAESRAHRFGQKNNVFVYYLTFENTIEDAVWVTLKNKLTVVSATLGDEDSLDVVNSLYENVFLKK